LTCFGFSLTAIDIGPSMIAAYQSATHQTNDQTIRKKPA